MLMDDIDLAAAFWWRIDGELVCSGDSGDVDAVIGDTTGNLVPGPASHRPGVDVEARHRRLAVGRLRPRARALPAGDFVPLAPKLIARTAA